MSIRSNQVVLKNVRFSYAHVLRPQTQDDGTRKYSVTVLLPKSDKDGEKRLKKAIKLVEEEAVPTKWGGKKPTKIQYALYDGDGERPSGEPFPEECKGCFVLTARASEDRKPQVINKHFEDIIDQTEFYSGCYGDILLSVFAYAAQGKKGISFGLEMVRKTKDGEPLGGSIQKDPREVFGDDEEDDFSLAGGVESSFFD